MGRSDTGRTGQLLMGARAILLLASGAVPIALAAWHVSGAGWNDSLFFLHYCAPMYFIVPLFLYVRLGRLPDAGIKPFLIDVVVILLTASRLFSSLIPVSGHMIFLTYTAMTVELRWFRGIALSMIIHASLVKLILWGDFFTWGLGVAAGLAAAQVYRRIKTRDGSPK